MSNMNRKPLILILACFLAMGTLHAQVNVMDSDPIAARKRLVYSQVGAFVGLGSTTQGGTFTTDCNCDFTGGAGAGFVAGLMFERLTRSQFTWGVTLGYDSRGLTGRFREEEGVVQTSPSGRSFTVPITFLNEAQLDLNVLTAMPYVKHHFFDLFFARLGASVGYVFSSGLSHTKTLETETVTFPNGEVATVSLPGGEGTSVSLQNGPLADLNSVQLGIVAGVGMEIRLSKKMFLSPTVQFLFPVTSISAQGAGFSVRSLQFSAEVRHIL
ncbi:MAG: outer membrane beta-barrel protein [Ignavibacteria bacterium]|nr:outer membrane beta-barrel protein [Ignavibacteria bacterium]MBP6509792.1 outer membrane beta-barrel protein [Candidatus Kapabacteria bacterium]MBK6419745.1 outer membrane beta-barrel protein [Ignavibacteria bacterium]MBK6759624.1 outer membrane beta-barrel protein [Ignavibacteria bacterium]MBK7184516.1 outer membrane beta-barrel protein [Ignavibacteria bacterium]